MQYTRYHGKNIAFGYGTYFPYWYRQQFPELMDCPQPTCINRLRIWGIKYLLVNKGALEEDSDLIAELNKLESFEQITEIDGIVVYEFFP